MRMRKNASVVMLVAALSIGLAVGVTAASSSQTVNATFSIPSWIALSVIGNGDVGFGEIAGAGGYLGDNVTELRVLSTSSWSLASTILWGASTFPAGASQSIIEQALELSLSADSGSWGIHFVDVDYEMTVAEEDLAELPVGDYNLVIQFTATTD